MSDESLLYDLIRYGDLQRLKSAFESDPYACAALPYGQSLILHAVFENQIDVLGFLINQGCDLNKGDVDGITPLHAAAQKENTQAAKMLIASNARIDIEDNFGNTPLLEAVFVYRDDRAVPLIESLLMHGADPCHENKSGVSPCSFAIKTGKQKLVAVMNCENCSAK